ncbi:MAG: S8 family serine peptidase [Candidatus Nitrosotenuis sp.]
MRQIFAILAIVGIGVFALAQADQSIGVLLDKSAKYVGAQHPQDLGYYGKNIKVAIIDTGVDYTHPDISGLGPDGKIIGGYDFVENDNTPQDTNGHGTEVAGIIAASGAMRGIAPEAKILAYRVSDTGNLVSSDLIVKAIQRSVQDDADVINLSLGVNRTNDRIEDAINDAVRKGVVVVAAAGNSGPELGTIGSPGRDTNAITVGATYNNITASLVATLEINGMRFQVLPMVGSDKISEPITTDIVFGKYGRASDLAGIDVKDKILLVERGSDIKGELVYFTTKEKNAADSGAKTIIVYNNEPGVFLGDLNSKAEGPEYHSRILVMSMSKEDGLLIRSMLANKTVGTVNAFYHPDFVSFFSSRGPVSPFYIKPDLVAPGVFVNTTSLHGTYNLTSGTSFAAPHVSAASALLLQRNPELTPEQIKSIITTTTDPVSDTIGNLFPQEISGAGRLNITKAFDANLIISPSFAVFDLSPFVKSQIIKLDLETINHSKPNPRIDVDFGNSTIKFEHWIDGSSLFVKAEILDQEIGQYQGDIIISDKVIQHVPVLLRISDGAVGISNDKGKLNFKIDSQRDWSYAKISVYNGDYRLVNSLAITPTKSESVTVSNPGKYFVQADLKAGNQTITLYNSIQVESTDHAISFNIGIPNHQLAILGVIGAVVGIVGAVIRKR